MRLPGKKSMRMASFSSKRNPVCKAFVLFFLCQAANAAQPASTLIESAEFDDAFRSYMQALSAFSAEDLKLELSETIEDALTSGSHMSVTSIDYKVRQIEHALIAHLREELCAPSSPSSNELELLKLMAAKSAAAAAEQASVTFANAEFGMIAGVAVRLVQEMPHSQLCND